MRSTLQNLQPDYSPHDRQRRVITSLIVMSVMVMQTENMSIKEHKDYFDTDSKSIGIDNRCSTCILHDLNDFVGEVHIGQGDKRVCRDQNNQCQEGNHPMEMGG